MATPYDYANLAIGLGLLAATAYAALDTLLTRLAPETVVIGGSGTVGALVTLALFVTGGIMAVHGFSGMLRPRAG